MRKPLLALIVAAIPFLSSGQARLVLNNNAWMVIDGNAWVVIENPATNAITTAGTGGNILSENENDRIRWQIGTNTGAYVIPWTTPSSVKIPLTYTKSTAGVGPATASVVFSTYNYGISAPSWNNFNYRPSDVTHMNNFWTGTGLTPGATNESGHVVDRFWIMDTKATGFAYTTNPDIALNVIYEAAEVTAGNTIVGTSPLLAQRFNNGTNRWGDYIPTSNWVDLAGPTNQVTAPVAGVIPGAQVFRSWTLSDVADPLPIELTDFHANCEGSQVMVNWTTAVEQNNDYFTVERSQDGSNWEAIGTVDGAGNSIESITYSFVDIAPLGMAYYRLIQTDFDGSWASSNMIVAGCEAEGGLNIVTAFDDGEDLNVIVSSTFDAVHDVTLMDAQGKIMAVKYSQAITTGITQLRIAKNDIATGVYVVRLSNNEQVLSRRIVLN